MQKIASVFFAKNEKFQKIEKTSDGHSLADNISKGELQRTPWAGDIVTKVGERYFSPPRYSYNGGGILKWNPIDIPANRLISPRLERSHSRRTLQDVSPVRGVGHLPS